MKLKITSSFAFMMLFAQQAVWAFEENFSDGDLGYEVYDIFFNKILNGAIGWVAMSLLLVFGLFQLIQIKWIPSILAIASAVLIKLVPKILSSAGMTLDYAGMKFNALYSSIGVLVW